MKHRSLAYIFVVVILLLDSCNLPAGNNSGPSGDSNPQAWFDSPLSGSTLPLGPVEVISHFSDSSGVAEIQLLVNDEMVDDGKPSSPTTEGESLVSDKRDWTPDAPGEYTLKIRALGNNNSWGPYAETVVKIVAEQPTQETYGEIGGAVFGDQNGNGIQDADEGPLDGVNVTLKGCGLDVTTATGADGTFQFTNIPAGTCALEVSKDGWAFSSSSPNIGYPLPVASNPDLPTNVGILMSPLKDNTPTPIPNFGVPQLSSGQVYYGSARCEPNQLTVQLEAQHPDGIKVMVFFHRLHELNGSKDSGWSDGISMNLTGENQYSLAMSADRLLGQSGFDTQALVSYQFVMQTQKGEFLRSEVYSNLYLLPCGSQPLPSTTTTPGVIIIPPVVIATPTVPVIK